VSFNFKLALASGFYVNRPVSDVTQLLNAIDSGDPKAADQLLPLVYEELRKLAVVRMANEKAGQTLQPTALVHEAWLKIAGDGQETSPSAPFLQGRHASKDPYRHRPAQQCSSTAPTRSARNCTVRIAVAARRTVVAVDDAGGAGWEDPEAAKWSNALLRRHDRA
jgi:hypothetical protein